jgi:hypothetical protein
LRSGSDVHVKAGQARIDLVEGGQIIICGPAHFSMLKTGGAITLALDTGTIHAAIGSEVSLNIYTPQIQAHPISIGSGAEDVLVGLDSAGAMCIRANKGAVRVEQQLRRNPRSRCIRCSCRRCNTTPKRKCRPNSIRT